MRMNQSFELREKNQREENCKEVYKKITKNSITTNKHCFADL
jgi:hypothetical protein